MITNAKKQKIDHATATAAAAVAAAASPTNTTIASDNNNINDDQTVVVAAAPSAATSLSPKHIRNNAANNINSQTTTASYSCAGCGKVECAATGPLLLFEDPDEEEEQQQQQQLLQEEDRNTSSATQPNTDEKRYCPSCMTGKKVRVFWPVDSQWYIADVQQYDICTGEHLLRYPDGDTEWVRIGEDHTTNAQFKEYYRNQQPDAHPHPTAFDTTATTANSESANDLARLPSLGTNGGGMSFALSNMSQSFGLHSVAEEVGDDDNSNDHHHRHDGVLDGNETSVHLKPPSSSLHQQQHHHHQLYQQLNLDRTASSMSSFGMFGSGGGGGGFAARQPSFAGQHPPQPPPHGDGDGSGRGATNNYQILSPNFAHSFSSKIGTVPSMDFFPPPPPPPPPLPHTQHHPQHHQIGGRGDPHPHPSPNHHQHHHHHHHHHHPHQQQQPQHQHQREGGGEGANAWPPNPYANQTYYDERGHHSIIYPSQGGTQHQPTISKSGQNSTTSQSPNRHSSSELSPSKSSNNKKKSADGGATSGGSSAKTRKALPTAWAPAEDEHLLDLVLQMQHPLKWSVIAESLSNIMATADSRLPPRTGKQCRERYVNHLNPRLKNSDFTPQEDATIWRLYATIGSQWAKMSKVIPGRTDNNLKNRFHNLKRQLYREEDSRQRSSSAEFAVDMKSMVYLENVRDIPKFLRTKIEDMWNYKGHIAMVAAKSNAAAHESREEAEGKEQEKEEGGGVDATVESTPMEPRIRKFGPYEAVVEPTQCGRCGLFLPSVQCGNEICTKTRWCKVCTKVSLHLTGNVLRECMNLRKSHEEDLARALAKLISSGHA